ncbi:rhomboid family intramembrane serine protease [Streptomyces uncialis]|uniref:rhomboid family intramembrane serine protease n=1 Tax=Streptomyces uncialis TaxID=1048205 RepID=UPI003407669D
MIGSWGGDRTARPGGAARGRSAPVTYALIAACALVFLLGPVPGLNPGYGAGDELLAAQRSYFARWGVIPADLLSGAPRALLTPVTALFVHGSWLHLLGNMLFLHVFGVMAEERLGRLRHLVLYVVCGALALTGYATAHAGQPDGGQTLVGASGAISAVLGAFLYLFPTARVTSLFPFLFFLPLRFPAWMVLPFWVALQWLAASRDGQGPGVAYLAHLIGFGLGFLGCWAGYGGWWRRGPREPRHDQRGAGRGRARVNPPAAATEGDSQP